MDDKYKYEIVKKYFTIPESNDYSIQLNMIKWGNDDPKYDLRRWKDGEPLKGFSLSEDSLMMMCKAMMVIAAKTEGELQELEEINEVEPIDCSLVDCDYYVPDLNEKIIEILSRPVFSERKIKLREIIDNEPILNVLYRNDINTLSELLEVIKSGVFPSIYGITVLREEKVYKALFEYIKPKCVDTTGFKTLFIDVDNIYDDMPIESVLMFTNHRTAVKRLSEAGYDTIGQLNGIFEITLEKIVGNDRLFPFIELEKALHNKPEIVIASIWNSKKNTREESIVRKRANGKTLQEIADEEGLTRERVRQLIPKFYMGQEHFLNILKKRIEQSDDRIGYIKKLFPDKNHRIFYLLWEGEYKKTEDIDIF